MNQNAEKVPKVELTLNLSPSRKIPDTVSPNMSSIVSVPSPVSLSVSSEHNGEGSNFSSCPDAIPMVVMACPRCMMYIMVQEHKIRCPKCWSTDLIDFTMSSSGSGRGCSSIIPQDRAKGLNLEDSSRSSCSAIVGVTGILLAFCFCFQVALFGLHFFL